MLHFQFICGSRKFPIDIGAKQCLKLLDLRKQHHGENLVVLHGACPEGADYWADEWCKTHGVQVMRMPAMWNAVKRSAGPRRNARMAAVLNRLRHAPATRVYAAAWWDGKSKGAGMMIDMLREVDIEPQVYLPSGPIGETYHGEDHV